MSENFSAFGSAETGSSEGEESLENPSEATEQSADGATGDAPAGDGEAASQDQPGSDFEVDLSQTSFSGAEGQGSGDDLGIDLDFGGSSAGSDSDSGVNLDFEVAPEPEEAEEAPEESGAGAEEAALEEFRAELRSKIGEWYAVHTYSGMENRVKQNLDNRVSSLNMEDYIFEVVVPTEEVTEIKNGQRKQVKRTTLPGYVLVRLDMTDESWSTVRHTPSVTGFVGHSNNPVPLGLDEVERMLAPAVTAAAAAAAEAPASKKKQVEVADYAVGDSVMVIDGPFAGVHASIIELNANAGRVKALVEILGRETPVDLTFSQIQKV